jgi:GT2 family glycosyltransferase
MRRWGSNRGFARAVNEGCRLARGEWLLLLNPDMTAPPGFLDDVLARAEDLVHEDENAGIVGFRLVNRDGTVQLSTGAFPTLSSSVGRLLLPRSCRKYTMPEDRGRTQVDWVTGCCMLVRRDCWNDLGGLDPDFFLYYEDVDLCRRAAQRGWSVWYDPTVRIVHHNPLHGRAVPAHLRLITRHALLTYARKHWSSWQRKGLGGLVRLEAGIRRMLAWWSNDSSATRAFRALSQVVDQVDAGKADEARQHLLHVVRAEEAERVPVAVDRHPRALPTRSARILPGERAAACAAWFGSSGGR